MCPSTAPAPRESAPVLGIYLPPPGLLGARPPAGRVYVLSLLCLLPLNPELRSLLFWLPKKPGLRMETSRIQTPACHQSPGSWLECYLPAPAQVLGRTQASDLDGTMTTRLCPYPCIPTMLSKECNLLGPSAAFLPCCLPGLDHTPSFPLCRHTYVYT